ncbi:MAG: hypothetical protein FWF78_07665, partial [Defluviitaleaceae bacterium]|nr:hypothetical protein [Defluviitaleaceae bacterium]
MKNFKKHISLWLVVVMVFSLFAPFSIRRVTVYAQTWIDEMGARGGELAATFHGMLSPPSGQMFPELTRRVGGDPVVTEGSVLVNWELARSVVWDGDMDVLRFFDEYGRRHELSVKRIMDYGGTIGLMVNYDIYVRRFDAAGDFVGYRHIGDPLFGAGAAGGFAIYAPGIGYLPAPQFFAEARNPGVDNPELGTILNRVNNRSRFMDPLLMDPWVPADAPERFTPTHPYFFDFINNPNDLVPAANQIFYQRLSPSFNISHNMGYSFRFGGSNVHFLWQDDQFYFYIEGIDSPFLSGGAIHEFTLERYSAIDARQYFRGVGGSAVRHPDGYVPHPSAVVPHPYPEYIGVYTSFARPPAGIANQPAMNVPVIDNPLNPDPDGGNVGNRRLGRVGHVYVIMGVSHDSVNTIPFAQNIDPLDPDAGFMPHVRNTHILREDTAPRGPLVGTGFVSGVETPNVSPAFPSYDHEPLDMTTRPYPIQPVEPDVGLDIRFNLPMLFSEDRGSFSEALASNLPLHDSLEVWLNMGIAGGPTSENLQIEFNIRDLEPYGVNPYGSAPGIINPPNHPRFELHDISLLTRQAQQTYPDRVRIKVGGMTPSIHYNEVFLAIVPIGSVTATTPANVLGWTNAQVSTPVGSSFYTFLRYEFTEQAGRPFIRIEPFNYSVNRVRAGFYQMVGAIVPGGYAIQSSTAGSTTPIFFPLPSMEPGVRQRFHITWSETTPLVGTPLLRHSQEVWWSPDGRPTISLPENFTISNVLNRPVRGDIHAGSLVFNASWDVGIMQNIVDIVNNFETTNEYLELSYMMGIATEPESMTTNPGHTNYMLVQMQIRRNPAAVGITTPSAITVSPLLVRYKGSFMPTHEWQHFNDPIVNNGRVAHSFGGVEPAWSDDGWQELGFRMDPATMNQMFFASIDIATDSIRRYRPVPPPPTMRRDFMFPGLYFLNVRLHEWNLDGNPGATWSRFDYIVVNDVTELAPPPPVNLDVTASNDPEEPPELNVSFQIPGSAIRNYLNTMYEMEVQVWTNLYIGQFENAIMETFFHGPAEEGGEREEGRPLAPAYREVEASLNVPFSEVYYFNAVEGRMEIDLSATDIQNVLRGAIGGGAGVVRIVNVPLITTTTPSALIGIPVNFDYLTGGANIPATGTIIPQTPEMVDSFAETNRIIGLAGNHSMSFHLTGVEENRAYFVFMDMSIQKFVEEDNDTWQLRDGSPGISDLTGIATATTIGTVQRPPGPGDIIPSAPSGLGVRDVEQMSATIYWDPMHLTSEQTAAGTRIEWEIMRFNDISPFNEPEELLANRNDITFHELFDTFADFPSRKAWITDDISLTTLPGNIFFEEPNEDIYYRYVPSEVYLTDRTLLPNELYFYYVRTVRIDKIFDHQLDAYVEIRTASVWSEIPVTTTPIQPPINLRQEDPSALPGFDAETMVYVSWEHQVMHQILEAMGEQFIFQYQMREGEGAWGEVTTVTIGSMTPAALDPSNPNRIRYLISGLQHSTMYQMRVRLHDITAGDSSLWSNTITFLTDINQEDGHLDREVDDWLNYLRRRLEEILRQPFWTVRRTPTSNVLVYRPEAVFTGFMESIPGTALPLENLGKANTVFYLPTSIVLTANENRRGFSTSFDDIEFLLAPSFLNPGDNQPVMDMLRALDARGSVLTDSFVRITIDRSNLAQLNNVPAITASTNFAMDMVATNNSIRNINTWDRTMLTRATQIVERWLADPVIRQGFRDQLVAEMSNEEISDHVYHIINRVEAEIIAETNRFIRTGQDGILSSELRQISEFDAAMHVVAVGVGENMFASGYRVINNNWQQQNLVEHHNGRAFVARGPGMFAFTGRVVDIPGIEEVPRGNVVTG